MRQEQTTKFIGVEIKNNLDCLIKTIPCTDFITQSKEDETEAKFLLRAKDYIDSLI